MINGVADQQSLSRHISGNLLPRCQDTGTQSKHCVITWLFSWQPDASRHDTSFVQRQVNTQQTNFLQISKYILEENSVLRFDHHFLYNQAFQYLVEHKKILAQARRSRSEEEPELTLYRFTLKQSKLATNGLNLSKWGLIRCKIFADSLRHNWHKKLRVLKVDSTVIKLLPAKAWHNQDN